MNQFSRRLPNVMSTFVKPFRIGFTHILHTLVPISGGPALAVFVCALLLAMTPSAGGLETPPRISRDAMPNTSFTCDDKASGGYYADPEAECQMFHVCVRVSEDEIRDHKFLCPNDTIFDQQNFICASYWDTDCKKSERYYNKNDLFRVNDPWASPDIAETTSPPEPEPQTPSEEELYYEYLLEYENSKKQSPVPEEYDYQYYDFNGGSEDGTSGKSSRGNNFSYDDRPPLARSVSESSSSSNVLSPSKGYVISAQVESESTIKPLLISTSQVDTTTKRTTAVTTTTERRTTAPTTERTTTTTTTTTQASPYKSTFEASFNVGEPVVSVSSTSSRLEVSSPRYESSTPQYGFFSVQLPSTTPSYKPRLSSTTTTTTTPRPTDTTKDPLTTPAAVRSTAAQSESVYEEVKEYKAEELASFSDFEDPFADIDWKRDPSSVTATTKTRYETDFGPTASERRPPPTVFPIGRRRVATPEAVDAELVEKEPLKSVSVTSSSSSSIGSSSYVTATRTDRNPRGRNFSNGSITGRRRGAIREDVSEANGKPRRIFTGPSRQDFSNFRYFKTAFGSTESPKESTRPNRSRQSTGRPSDSLFSRRSSNGDAESSDRPARTASRSTRYSIYAR